MNSITLILEIFILSSVLFLYDRPFGARKPKTDSYEKIKKIKLPKPSGIIGHNPSPPKNFKKPGFFPIGNGYQPKLRYHDNSELDLMRKPPSTGSGIK